jgi:drug/metabolite transporter (DMT)-like permease
MNSIKNYIRLIVGIITALLGIVFLFIPFLPFGYLLLFISAFFLARYIPILKRIMSFLRKKDKKGYIQKAEEKIRQFQDWIDRKLTGGKKEPQKD